MRLLALAWVLYALVASGLLAVNMPPFSHADEVNHMLRADQVSRGGLVGIRFDGGTNSGGAVSPGILAAAAPFEPVKFHNEQRATAAMFLEAMRAGWRGAPVLTGFANTSIYPPFFYVPAALGIGFGKLTRMPVIHSLYLARLLTGLASGACIGLALLLCIRAGREAAGCWIFLLAAMPMSLALQNACSQDGLALGVAALGGALLARLRREPVGFVPFCLCLAFLLMARPPYLPLALLPFATVMPWRMRVIGAGAVAAAGLGWTALAGIFAAIDTTAGHGANIGAQLRVLLDPGRTLALVQNTFGEYGRLYLEGFIGRPGWLDVPLPGNFITAYAILILVIFGLLATAARPLKPALWLGAAVLATAVLIFLVQYLTWTPVGDGLVDGVQGRYFLPPAFLLAGTFAAPGPRPRLAAALLPLPAIALAVTMRAIILRYYGPV